MRQTISNALKILITVAGLVYVVLNVPLSEIGRELEHIQWGWVILAFSLITIGLVVRAYRWYILLIGLGVAIPFRRLVSLYFVGNFFNAFLPSGFGGDVVRVWEVAQEVPTNVAAGTVIVDRLTGLLMLFVMALLAIPFRPETFPVSLTWQLTVISVVGLIGGFVLMEGNLIKRLGGWLPGKLSVVDPKQPLAKLLQAVQECGRTAVGKALLVSTGFNVLLTIWWYLSGLAFGYDVPFVYYFLVVPILSVLLLIPSISGLGVRETVAPLLFAPAGLTPAQAVSVSLMVFILTRVSGLLGAPIYLWSTLHKNEKRATQPIDPS